MYFFLIIIIIFMILRFEHTIVNVHMYDDDDDLVILMNQVFNNMSKNEQTFESRREYKNF